MNSARPSEKDPWAERYGLAVASVGLALLVRTALDPYLHEDLPFVTFFVAVTVTAWFAGWRPSLVSTALGFLAGNWFFVSPRHSLWIKTYDDAFEAAGYFAVALAIAFFGRAMHKSRDHALSRQREIEREAADRRRAEEAVGESNQRLTIAQRAAGAGVWGRDYTTGRTDWSPELFELLGLDPAKVTPSLEAWQAVVHPEDREEVRARIYRAMKDHTTLSNEYRIVRAGGEVRWIYALGQGAYDEQTQRTWMTGICIDITERKRAEEELKRAHDELEIRVRERTAELNTAMEALAAEKRRFSDVLDVLPAYVVLLSPDYHVPFANRFFRERFGEANGKRCFEYLFGRGEPCEVCESLKVLETLAPHRWEWTGPDGHNYDIYDFPFTEIDGTTLVLEMGIDITDRKQAEAELGKYRQHLEELVSQRTSQLEAVLESLPVGIAILDAQGGHIRSNRAFGEIWGGPRPPTRAIDDYAAYKAWRADTGRPVQPDEWASAHVVRYGTAVVGQSLEVERFDGTRRFVLNSAAPVRDAEGRNAGCVVAIQDIP